MSNYHVELIDKPAALTKEAIKSLRKQQVQGLSRRQLMRAAIGTGIGLWLLEVTAGTLAFAWPNLSGGFGAPIQIGDLDTVKLQNGSLPIEEGFPAYYPDARAFVILFNPGQQRFTAGEDTTGDGAAFGPAPRSMDRFSITVDASGVLTINTGKITLGPLPVALGQPGLIPPRTPTGCI
jgi:hypothetical protein